MTKDGIINYYKDKALHRGFIKLTLETKVLKTGKDRFEIINPNRTYYLSETDNFRLSSDEWIEKIKEYIGKLKK